jgi:hypothetical protein
MIKSIRLVSSQPDCYAFFREPLASMVLISSLSDEGEVDMGAKRTTAQGLAHSRLQWLLLSVVLYFLVLLHLPDVLLVTLSPPPFLS